MLAEVITVLYESTDPVLEFVTLFNSIHGSTPISSIVSDDFPEVISDLVDQIMNIPGLDFFDTLFSDVFSDLTLEATFNRLKRVFSKWMGEIDLDSLLDLFIPKFRAELKELSIGVQFPTSLFRQVDELTLEPLEIGGEDVPSILRFNVGRIVISSERGFEFENESSFDFPFSEVLRTGFFIKLTKLKVDLSRTKNIQRLLQMDVRAILSVFMYRRVLSVFRHFGTMMTPIQQAN